MRQRRPSPPIEPGTVVCGYTVLRRLGAGGYGTVFLARERDGGLFALKFLSREDVGRWGEREVSILLRLQHLAHPNVVRLVSHTLWPVAAPEYLVIVMEYVRGRSLDKWARAVNPPARAVAGAVLDVARALAAVHAEGVVHRDVKGSNVLLREEDGRAVLADFGVGGYPGAPGLTRYPFLPGTPAYRSPEAWRYQRECAGQPGARYEASAADDLWALGVTLYWLLTDRYPFEAADDAADVEAVLHRTPAAPHAVDGRVPEALGRMCLRMLEKRPEARYPDAAALGAALEEALAGADAAWDVPLCDFHDVHTATTQDAAPDLLAWAGAPQRPPRRGPRPKPESAAALEGDEAEAALPEAAPPAAPSEAEGTAPSEGPALAAADVPVALVPATLPAVRTRAADAGELRQRKPAAWAGGGVAVGLALLGAAVGVLWWGAQARVHGFPSRHAVVAGPTVQEVAPPGRPPEADRTTAPPTVAAPPVAVASVAALPEDSPPMKKPQPPTAPLKKQLQQAGSVAGACITLACTGPQVRPAPPPEDCPEEVVTTMEELGIDIGYEMAAQFTGYTGEPRVITVRGGGAQVVLAGGYSKQFRSGTVLSCQLTLSERVYGRCNWAREFNGKSFPVCFQLHDSDGPLGLKRDTEGDADSVGTFNAFSVKPVRRFE